MVQVAALCRWTQSIYFFNLPRNYGQSFYICHCWVLQYSWWHIFSGRVCVLQRKSVYHKYSPKEFLDIENAMLSVFMSFICVYSHQMISELPTVCWMVLFSTAFPESPSWCGSKLELTKNDAAQDLGNRSETAAVMSWRSLLSVGWEGSSLSSSLPTPYPSVLPNSQPLCSVAPPGPPPDALLWSHRGGSFEEPNVGAEHTFQDFLQTLTQQQGLVPNLQFPFSDGASLSLLTVI